jgi:hypothetical protein
MLRKRALTVAFWMALTASAEDLPQGRARAIVISKCGECHGLDVVTSERADKARWQAVVEAMVVNGAKLTRSEVKLLVGYLAKNFPATK